IDGQPAVREDAGNQPAFQADPVVAARKADIGEAKGLARWSLDDRFGRLINKLLGDVARNPDIPERQQTCQDHQSGDGPPPRHAHWNAVMALLVTLARGGLSSKQPWQRRTRSAAA